MTRYVPSAQDMVRIDNIFIYHTPKGDQSDRYVALREKAKELAELMLASCPPSQELSLAITNLQTAVFYANASIAINE